MEAEFEVLKLKMKDIFDTKRNIILTSDLWTKSITTKAYLGISAHYLDGMYLVENLIILLLIQHSLFSQILLEVCW